MFHVDQRARAIEELYRRRYRRFHVTLSTISGGFESGHDAVQETFARALKQRAQFRGEGSLEAWVWRIGLRTAAELRGGRDSLSQNGVPAVGRDRRSERGRARGLPGEASSPDRPPGSSRQEAPVGLKLRRRPAPSSARTPPPLPPSRPVQHGGQSGASVDVYRTGLVAFDIPPASGRAYRLLEHSWVSLGCARVAYGAGRWATLGGGRSNIFFSEHLRAMVGGGIRFGGAVPPPYDACSVRGTYGWRWGSKRGWHDAVEIGLTPLGHRFLDEKAAARELAYFVRSPTMTRARDAMKHGAMAPRGAAIARHYSLRVKVLQRPGDLPPPERIGIWSDRGARLVASIRTPGGRRLFVELDHGRIGRYNLRELAFVF